jgi:hypothetical protein
MVTRKPASPLHTTEMEPSRSITEYFQFTLLGAHIIMCIGPDRRRTIILRVDENGGTRMKWLTIMVVPLLVLCLLTSGCSVFMAASRSSYRGDINVIQLGVQRSVVIAELGPPDAFSTLENGGYDDRYTLDPNAHRTGTKVVTTIFYLAADLFTLCLWEFIGTPLEIAAKDKISVYHLTYSPEGKLSSMEKI